MRKPRTKRARQHTPHEDAHIESVIQRRVQESGESYARARAAVEELVRMTRRDRSAEWVDWWLSFADESGFLGACIVPGADLIDAAGNAHALKCNPGGEVQGYAIPQEDRPFLERKWMGRLLTREEAEAFSAELVKRRRS